VAQFALCRRGTGKQRRERHGPDARRYPPWSITVQHGFLAY